MNEDKSFQSGIPLTKQDGEHEYGSIDVNEKAAQSEAIADVQTRFAATDPASIEAYILIIQEPSDEDGRAMVKIEHGGTLKSKIAMLQALQEAIHQQIKLEDDESYDN